MRVGRRETRVEQKPLYESDCPLLSVQLEVILNIAKLLPRQFVSFSFDHRPNSPQRSRFHEGDVIWHLPKKVSWPPPMTLPIISTILVPVQSKSIPKKMSALVPTTLNSVANSASFGHCVKRKSTFVREVHCVSLNLRMAIN
jgi:hypothetical protein